MAERASSSIVIDAPVDAVMAVIADFGAYPTWTPQVKHVEVLETDEAGRGTVARFQLDAGVVKDDFTLAYDWSVPDAVSWRLTKGQIQKRQEGSYALRPVADGTEVFYDLTVELAIPTLGLFKRKAEKMIIDTALRGLKRHVEAR